MSIEKMTIKNNFAGTREIKECTICGERTTVSNATPEWELRHRHPVDNAVTD